MPRAQWPLVLGRPSIPVELSMVLGGAKIARTLLADTGAGSTQAPFKLLLDENDCLICAGKPSQSISLGGAYSGSFPLYRVGVAIPSLGFNRIVSTVGIPHSPTGFDGIAGFRFLNRFTYGNFASAGEFGLET